MNDVDIIFLAVSTPTKLFGEGEGKSLDISYVEDSTR